MTKLPLHAVRENFNSKSVLIFSMGFNLGQELSF